MPTTDYKKTLTILKWNIFFAVLLGSLLAVALLVTSCANKSNNEVNTTNNGSTLFTSVKKFVSIGEHRTGTPEDLVTSEWLRSELDLAGYKTEFVEFPLRQFFFKSGKLSSGNQSIDIFPIWPVKDDTNLAQTGKVIDGDKLKELSAVKGNLVLTRLKEVHGASNPEIASQINSFINAGALAVLAITENNTGEVVALNTFDNQTAWKAPVYHLAPKDSSLVLKAIADGSLIGIQIKGNMQAVNARNVLGKIGSGPQHVVISTPISGWFTTGGERGPGIAVWLGLARWASQNSAKYPEYTFVFTGHSGHELSLLGAKAFVEKAAPKPEDTKLWIHLGAAVAVREWKEENGQWTMTDSVDSRRGIYYSEAVAESFEKTFENVKAKKVKGTEQNKESAKPGGEGALFQQKGYNNLVSIAHGHRLHHVKTDDEHTTSPQLLQELEVALENFISAQLALNNN